MNHVPLHDGHVRTTNARSAARVAAWLGADSEGVVELVREKSMPTLGVLSHRDQVKDPPRTIRIDFDGRLALPCDRRCSPRRRPRLEVHSRQSDLAYVTAAVQDPVLMQGRSEEIWSRPSGSGRGPILARPPARTLAAALLARARWLQRVGADLPRRCCLGRAGTVGTGRSSTPHKPGAGSSTD